MNVPNLATTTTFVVDDDPFIGTVYRKLLNDIGFTNVHHFQSGVDCLNNLHLSPEIILLDYDLPKMTGFEVLKKIKRVVPDSAVIMISGQEDMATALNTLKYGAFDYIIKDGTETTRIELALARLERLKSIRPAEKSFFKKLF